MSVNPKRPIMLLRASAWRTYTGGKLIDALHGLGDTEDTNFPEEWIMSTVSARNSGREHIVEGLSMIKGTDISLADFIEENSELALGKKHIEKYGKKLGVLVKLIDSAERLTVQVHPTRSKAMDLFNSLYGKTECWHIIGGRAANGEKPSIYFGFKEGITRERWKEIFEKQDISAMLDCLHKFEVEEGDTFLIEGGIPHAIGAGCFLVELQEPTDYTIRTEKVTPNGLEVSDFMCHQGLGFDKMFDCFDYNGYTREEILRRYRILPNGENIVSYDNTEMFRLTKKDICGEHSEIPDGQFYGIYVLSGSGKIDSVPVCSGSQFFITSSCEQFKIEGDMTIMKLYGPKENV